MKNQNDRNNLEKINNCEKINVNVNSNTLQNKIHLNSESNCNEDSDFLKNKKNIIIELNREKQNIKKGKTNQKNLIRELERKKHSNLNIKKFNGTRKSFDINNNNYIINNNQKKEENKKGKINNKSNNLDKLCNKKIANEIAYVRISKSDISDNRKAQDDISENSYKNSVEKTFVYRTDSYFKAQKSFSLENRKNIEEDEFDQSNENGIINFNHIQVEFENSKE